MFTQMLFYLKDYVTSKIMSRTIVPISVPITEDGFGFCYCFFLHLRKVIITLRVVAVTRCLNQVVKYGRPKIKQTKWQGNRMNNRINRERIFIHIIHSWMASLCQTALTIIGVLLSVSFPYQYAILFTYMLSYIPTCMVKS